MACAVCGEDDDLRGANPGEHIKKLTTTADCVGGYASATKPIAAPADTKKSPCPWDRLLQAVGNVEDEVLSSIAARLAGWTKTPARPTRPRWWS